MSGVAVIPTVAGSALVIPSAEGTPGTPGPPGPPGSGSTIGVKDEGTLLGTVFERLNFTGAGVNAFGSGADVTINIPGVDGGGVVFRPEAHGALGNGSTNDTSAFQAVAAAVTAAGGGIIELKPGATYIVGRQSLVNDGTWMFKPEDILYLTGLSGPIIIRGNGAKLKFANGLKFGTFNSSGTSTSHTLPYFGGDMSGVALHEAIISLVGNSGPIHIENLELDGNVSNMTIGGDFGDTGKQIKGDGLFLSQNTGALSGRNVKIHHFPRDGMELDCIGANTTGSDIPRYPNVFENFTIDLNCRNNVSCRGGRGMRWINLSSTSAGQSSLPFSSAPSSCFDLETEVGSVRDMLFEDCTFSNGGSTSFVSDTSDTIGLYFKRCQFDSPTTWAAYILAITDMVFEDCRFFGPLHYGDPSDLTRAARFSRCHFTDKNGDSLSGSNLTTTGATLFDGAGGGAHGANVLFDQCTWDAHHLAPFAATGCIHQDSKIAAVNSLSLGSYGNNVFRGKTELTSDFSITAIVEQTGVKVVGTVFGNGTQWFYITGTYDPASLADGAGATTTLFPPRAKVGQQVEVTFSNDLQGINMFGWISAAQTASIRFENHTGGAVDLPSGTITAWVHDIGAA